MISIDDLKITETGKQELHKIPDFNEETLKCIFMQSPFGMIVVDVFGEIVMANSSLIEIFRYSSLQNFEKYGYLKTLRSNKRPYLLEEWPLIRSLVMGENVKGEKIPIERGDGSLGYISMSASPIYDKNGTLTSAVAFITDITTTQNKENQLSSALQERDEFISVASHELKTPLTSLGLQTTLLERNLTSMDPTKCGRERMKKIAATTHKQILHLTSLVDNMLDLGRIHSEQMAIEKDYFNLSDLVKDVIGRMKFQFFDAGAPAPKFLGSDDAFGNFDRQRVEQVINNLLTNTIRYGQKKPVVVGVRSLPENLIISVKDHGIGIDPKDKDLIFDRFGRVKNKEKPNGLGLGLFIAREIVLQHGGRIWVESKIGQGSTFFVSLPKDKLNRPPERPLKN